jgi:hypothetical protein
MNGAHDRQNHIPNFGLPPLAGASPASKGVEIIRTFTRGDLPAIAAVPAAAAINWAEPGAAVRCRAGDARRCPSPVNVLRCARAAGFTCRWLRSFWTTSPGRSWHLGVRQDDAREGRLKLNERAEIVRFGKIATVVANGARCASACFIVFAGRSPKFASYGASVGVHGASDQTGRETVEAGAATVSMARIVPASSYGRQVGEPLTQRSLT